MTNKPEYDCDEKEQTYIPERRLVAAVVFQAIADLICPHPEHRKQASAWIRYKNIGGPRLTFNQCCQALDMDPDAVIKALKERGFFKEETVKSKLTLFRESRVARNRTKKY